MSDMPTPDFGVPTPIQDELKKLHHMKILYRAADEVFQDLKGRHDAFQARLYDRMDDEGVLSLKTDEARFDAKMTTYHTITNMDEFRAWLDSNDLTNEFIKDAPEKARLNELVRQRLDDGDELPPGLGSYDARYISITANKV